MGIQLSPEIRQLRSACLSNPGMSGVLRALLVLLEQAPDGAIIAAALEGIDPETIDDADLRERAARLLQDAGHTERAAAWRSGDAPAANGGNVVSLAAAREGTARGRKTRAPDGPTFDDIGGLEDVKTQIRRKIINPFLNRGLFSRFRRKAGGGILMYGPPGCGKTALARALANECAATFIHVRAADILDQYVGNAEKRIASLFEQARNSRPAVLFFDEVEALAQRRQFSSIEGVNTVVSALLTEMDGLAGDNEGILFLGATNLPWSIDMAFRRPGRFDRTIFVPPPDKVARRFILKRELEGRPVEPALDLEPVVRKTAGFSGADLQALVETAVDYAIEESMEGEDLKPLANRHFDEALREVRPSTGEWLYQASNFSEYANKDGLYDDLRDFLKKHAR